MAGGFELYFGDEMRYGLISNLRRSWSRVGERAFVPCEQAFDDRYLFSAVAPVSGKSFHLIGIDGFDSAAASAFLLELKKQHPGKTVVLVWDNAPCHRPMVHRKIPGIVIIFLPPYSPKLNPAERFFEEMRRATANQKFETIAAQEAAIEEKLLGLVNDPAAMKRLTGYEWILKQCSEVS